MVKKKIILIVLIVLLSAAFVHGAEVRYDGNFWRQSDQTTKEFFIYAVLGGITVGQDRVVGSMMQDMTKPDFNLKCFQIVSKIKESLEIDLRKTGTVQVVDGIDQFYSDFKNRSIIIKWAFLVVMQQIKGTPKEEIEKFIEHVRKNPD